MAETSTTAPDAGRSSPASAEPDGLSGSALPRRRLSVALRTVVGVVALLAVVLAAFTATSLALSGRAVDAQLDQRVDQAWERSLTFLLGPGGPDGGASGVFPGGGSASGDGPPDGMLDRSPLEAPGQPAGMLALVIVGGSVVEASRLDVDGNAVELSETDVRALQEAAAEVQDAAGAEQGSEQGSGPGSGGTSMLRAVDLEAGRYLVRADTVEAETDSGQVTEAVAVAGLPTAEVDGTKASLVWVQVIGSLAALVVAGVAGWWWIRRSLRPLGEVSRAAARVAEVPMASGTVALARYRVPEELAQPVDEVGDVGHALNRLIDAVDGAFEERNRSEQRLRTFVADASHELRTPLVAVRGYTEMVQLTEPLTGRGRDSVARVLQQADRMGSLVEDLLLLARLDAGRDLERGEVDLGEIVVDAIMDATAAGRDHRCTVDVPDVPEEAVTVVGDRRQLAQLAANLLSNARKHTPAGTTVLVRLETDAASHVVRLEVEDDGPGIAPELVPTLFDRFVRGDSARTTAEGSTGLGLSIVQSVARAHGGGAAVESEPGRTLFVVELPLA